MTFVRDEEFSRKPKFNFFVKKFWAGRRHCSCMQATAALRSFTSPSHAQSLKSRTNHKGLLYMYSGCGIDFMLAIRLDPEIESCLDQLAKKTGGTKTFYAREAILEPLEDLADIYLATRRLQRPAKTYSAQEVKCELGL